MAPMNLPDSVTWLLDPVSLCPEKAEVIIVVPPFAEPTFPALGPSLLKAGCHKKNISCHIYYANLVFAAMVGYELYQKIAWPDRPLMGEALFAPYVFNSNKEDLLNSLFKPKSSNTSDLINSEMGAFSKEEYLKFHSLIPEFLNYIVDKIINSQPVILGFNSLGEQNMSSLAIAQRIKEKSPEIITVMGGALVTHPMGKALLDITPIIDYVFSGKADIEFPTFCENALKSKILPRSKIINCKPIKNLDLVDIPNYDDFFEQLSYFQRKGLLPDNCGKLIPFETSRGCWWGAKCLCAFCGLNNLDLKYREKSKDRVIEEIFLLKDRYGVNRLHKIDNVTSEGFSEMLNEVISLGEEFEFICEVRPDLPPDSLDIFAKSGVSAFQAGVESLSSNILRKMRKGVSALQNLKFLREAGSRHFFTAWNFLLGVPGETQEDYEKILEILPIIQHLQPPDVCAPIRLDRYSPYFNNPRKFGISNIKPLEIYNLIYPPAASLDELALHFTGDYESILTTNIEISEKIITQIRRWSKLWQDINRRPRLSRIEELNGIPMIEDTRTITKQTFTALDDESFELLEILNEPTKDESIPEALRDYLPELLERKFVIFYEDHYISLVTDPQIGINLRKKKKSVVK